MIALLVQRSSSPSLPPRAGLVLFSAIFLGDEITHLQARPRVGIGVLGRAVGAMAGEWYGCQSAVMGVSGWV